MGKIYYEPPIIGIVTGVPGTGKTAISKGLSLPDGKVINGLLHCIMAEYIDKDRINDRFTDKREGVFYSKVREATYTLIDKLVSSYISQGKSVWVDATFSKEVKDTDWARRFYVMANETGARLKLIRCVAPEEVIKERLTTRGYERDKWKLEDWNRFMEEEPIHTPLQYGGIELDTSKNHKHSIQEILKFLSNK